MRHSLSVVAAASLALLANACASEEPSGSSDEVSQDGDGEGGDYYEPYDPGKADGATLGGPISFGAACAPGAKTTIAAVGDVLLHGPLAQQAVARKNSDRFRSLWAPISDLLSKADVTYANFEGPTARGTNSGGRSVTDPGHVFDGIVYASYPQFNYHGTLVDDLKTTGFDVISTANNHSLDRRQQGADRTVERLKEIGLPYTGTKSRDDMDAPWYTITEKNGFKIAWLACTFSTNGLPDTANQVLWCWDDEDEVKENIRDLKAMPGIDAVIVTPHWGAEYVATPSRDQRSLAKRFIDAGATAIIGAHPHVLQPWEKYTTTDGREAFIIYSLGNFVSNQQQLPRKSTMLLYLGLTRTAQGVKINGVSYVPMVFVSTAGNRRIVAIDREGGFADSRALTVNMFGTKNLQDPDEDLDTAQCSQ